MRKLFLLIVAIFITVLANAQYKLRVNEVDEFEGTIKKFTNHVKIGKTTSGSRVNADVMRLDDDIYIRFDVYSDLGCVSKHRSRAHLKFTDGSVLEMYSVSDTDCGDVGKFLFMMFEGSLLDDEFNSWTEDDLDEEKKRVYEIFFTKKLEKIKFSGSEYYTVLEVDDDRKDVFTHLFNLVK